MPKNRGLIGLLGLLIFVICLAAGFFFIQTHPKFGDQLTREIKGVIGEATTSTNSEFISPLSLARDQDRRTSVQSISDAIFQYTSEHKGLLPTDFPTQETCIGTGPNCYDLGKILLPYFVDQIPKDPQTGTDQNTGYTTYKNSDGRIVVSIKGENGGKVEIVR